MNLWLMFFVPATLLVLASEAGFRIGRRSQDTGENHAGQIGAIQGAILGLLGLLLGFSFSMALDRHETRRTLVVQEANAIGTTFLRAALLPEAHRAPVEDLLRRYVDLRLSLDPQMGAAAFEDALRRSGDIQRALWSHATAAAREMPGPVIATFITTLNETIDTEAERLAAARNHIPTVVWLLLLTVGACGCFSSGYGAGIDGARSVLGALLLPLLFSVVITLIADLATPRQGFITVSREPMIDLRRTMEPPPQ